MNDDAIYGEKCVFLFKVSYGFETGDVKREMRRAYVNVIRSKIVRQYIWY